MFETFTAGAWCNEPSAGLQIVGDLPARNNWPLSLVPGTELIRPSVSHGDVLKRVVLDALGKPIDFVDRIEIAPASVSSLVVEEWRPTLVRLNNPGEGPGEQQAVQKGSDA